MHLDNYYQNIARNKDIDFNSLHLYVNKYSIITF